MGVSVTHSTWTSTPADGLESGPDPREAVHEGADRVAAAARLELAERHAGGLHGAGHERAQRAAVVVEREARPQHLALVPVAEGVEGGAVHARRALRGRARPGRRRRRATRSSGGAPRRRVVAMPSAASRSSSCSAALRLKASIRMPDGSAPRSTSSTTRLTRVLVLPEPAGARTRAGPRACSTAARWASSSRAASGPAARARRGSAARVAGRGRRGRGRCRSRPPRASSRPMSSRSSAAASSTPRLRGASASGRTRSRGRTAARGRRAGGRSAAGRRRPAPRTPRPCPSRTTAPTGGLAAEQRPARARRGPPSTSAVRRSGRRGRPPPLAPRGRGGAARRRHAAVRESQSPCRQLLWRRSRRLRQRRPWTLLPQTGDLAACR